MIIYLVLLGMELLNHNANYSDSSDPYVTGIGFVMSVIIYTSVLFVSLYGIPISYAIAYFTSRLTKAKWIYSLLYHILFGILGLLLLGLLQNPIHFLSRLDESEGDTLLLCFIGAYFACLFAIGQQLIYRITKKDRKSTEKEVKVLKGRYRGGIHLNLNQKAIELLEENQYDESLKLFKKAVEISRDVQSLNNLAWIYCNEEDDDTSALLLLEEVINMNPKSHFPYNLLGEVYCRQEKWESTKDILEKAISIQPSKTAYNNLAVANYHLGNIEDASKYFLLASEPSDLALYSYVKCLIELGNSSGAKRKLDTFSENDAEFVGEVDVADLYVELDCYEDAIKWFEKGWNSYWKQPNWISRFIYSLLKMNNPIRYQELLNEAINEKIEEIKDAYEEECDEDWTESDKQAHIKELFNEKNEYEQMFEKISSGYIPTMEFDTSFQKACYLFGCNRHKHPEYKG